MLSFSSIQAQTLWFYAVLSWCVLDNLYFWYCVEIVIVCHGVTDALAEGTDLDLDITQEGAAYRSSHDHDCFRLHLVQIDFHGKP